MEFLQIFKNLDLLNIIKIIIGSLGFAVGLYYARFLKPFILWLKGGIENGDGVLENKDLQIATFTAFSGFILITIAFWSVEWPNAVIYAVFGTTAALFGIKNIGQSYVDSRKKDKNESGDDLG